MRLYPQFVWLVAVLSLATAAVAMTASTAPVFAKLEDCSVESTVATTITFTNLRNRPVSILWVNPKCQEVFYQTLQPGASYTQSTFVAQLWRVRDAQSRELLDELSPASAEPAHAAVGAYHLYLPLVTQTTESPVPGRAILDRPDDVSGYQVHVMYVVPSDGVDRQLDLNGSLANSVLSFQGWLAEQTGGTRLRFDTYQSALDVTFHRLSQSDATLAAYGAYVRDQVESGIHTAGFNEPNKLYAVYYDGTSNTACGGAAWPPALLGNAAVLYLQGLPNEPVPCNGAQFAASPTAPPEYLEFSMLHEIFHTLGAAPTCAARHVLQGHVGDSNTDLMYSGPLPWYPSVLDFGRDDYWGHNNPNCLDLSKSVFLDPLPIDASTPPGWP